MKISKLDLMKKIGVYGLVIFVIGFLMAISVPQFGGSQAEAELVVALVFGMALGLGLAVRVVKSSE